MPIILGIESSCDETSASVCADGQILSNIIATQKVHEQFGGVVPELASRAHIQNIVPVVDTAVKEAVVTLREIDAVAYTRAPGLIGSLIVGAEFAKSLSQALQVPLIGVHHMQAHVIANLIDEPRPSFPFLCLTVSGGHTQIVQCNSPAELKIIGETIDDAAGEAFDKAAKILGLPYPGGPLIDRYAKDGDPKRFNFPTPKAEGLNFSFSGLKTAFLYFIQNAGESMIYKETFRATDEEKERFIDENLADICASLQYRIVNILMKKLLEAARQTGIKEIAIAGGVSANSGLRKELKELGERYGFKTYIPKFEYCTDNAAMIAMTGYYNFLAGKADSLETNPSAKAGWD